MSPRHSGALWFEPVIARTRVLRAAVVPSAYDCVTVTIVRDGGAVLVGEFGKQLVNAGDVILLGPNTLCGGEPEGRITMTTIYADTDYVVDQVFWQYVGMLQDRLDAQVFYAAIYVEPAQILRLGEDRAESLAPWLEELVTLSIEGRPVENFYRMQALWFSITHVIAPFIKTSPIRTSSTQRATTWPTLPRHRRFTPLRVEARRAAELLRADIERRWSVSDLADEVHLSKSQMGRVFVEAYGKSPIAYLTMLRTERMAHLLRTTDRPLSAIAREVGWRDSDFAARQFRRGIGVTPNQYRSIEHAKSARLVVG